MQNSMECKTGCRKIIKVGTFLFDVSESASLQYVKSIKNIVKREKRDIELVIFHNGEPYPDFFEDTTNVNWSHLTPVEKATFWKRYNVDLMMFMDFPNPIYAIPYTLIPIPKIIYVKGDTEIAFPELYPKSEIRRKLGILSKRIYAYQTDQFISCSDAVSSSLYNHLNIQKERVTRVYFGLDERFYPRMSTVEVKDKYGISSPYIITVSNLSPNSNVTTLLESFKEAKKRGLDHQLVIVGRGWRSKHILERLESMGISQDVVLTGYIDDSTQDELAKLYSGSELLFLPSVKETFGMTILEALGCGTPVLTTRSHAIPEVAGDAGIYVDDPYDQNSFTDEMYRALSNKDRLDYLEERAEVQARRFSWAENTENIIDVIFKTYDSTI